MFPLCQRHDNGPSGRNPGAGEDGGSCVLQVTRTLGNVAVAEFVVLAMLTLWQWRRSRIQGAGGAAISFLLLARIRLASKGIRWGWIPPDLVLLKVLVRVLLAVALAFYRFAAAVD